MYVNVCLRGLSSRDTVLQKGYGKVTFLISREPISLQTSDLSSVVENNKCPVPSTYYIFQVFQVVPSFDYYACMTFRCLYKQLFIALNMKKNVKILQTY